MVMPGVGNNTMPAVGVEKIIGREEGWEGTGRVMGNWVGGVSVLCSCTG